MMTVNNTELNALIGSRICHDLISPVGAIGNGVELLGMTNTPESPELALIRQSVENASARIRFFRIAFGMVKGEQMIGRSEIANLLVEFFAPTRLTVHWAPTSDCSRIETKLVFLMLLCAESAMPYGGLIRVTLTDRIWNVSGEGQKLREERAVWDYLDGKGTEELTAAKVHFGLAYAVCQELERTIASDFNENRVSLTF
jgi:histidine phosphotransferase ChpT